MLLHSPRYLSPLSVNHPPAPPPSAKRIPSFWLQREDQGGDGLDVVFDQISLNYKVRKMVSGPHLGRAVTAVVIDLFSRRVVGWSMATHMRTELVLGALEMALGRRFPGPGLLHHSDRGSQYASHDYRKALEDHHIICSMSRKGNCWDNSVVESFFGKLKTELIYRRPWPSIKMARVAIADYIEVFYNRKRRHSFLGNISPAEFEKRFEKKAALAA
jgi:putative transposase